MATTDGEVLLMSNSGNLVNRIGKERKHKTLAIGVAVVAIGIAVAGWVRPVVKVIAERPVTGMSNSDCMEYAETMCDPGDK